MSAVILAVIVVMWAVVLVPMWLRRHDAATESRSADRFSAAMRVLSRRNPAGQPGHRYVLMPRRESRLAVHVSGAAVSEPVARSSRPVSRPTQTAPAPRAPRRPMSLAVRRRRAFLALAGVTLLTFVLAVAGVMGWVLQLVIDLVLVAFVVHLRTQAKRTAMLARQRRRAAVAPAASRTAAAFAAARADSAYAVDEPAYAAPPAPAAPEAAPVAAPAAGPLVAEEVAVAAATGTDDALADTAVWEPVPVPRPTYTMKPAAPPRHYPPVRPEADMMAEQEAVAAEAAGEDEVRLDEILTHRWAVND